jgi:3',5'-cyclic AMP phosphodiesterase CpdA
MKGKTMRRFATLLLVLLLTSSCFCAASQETKLPGNHFYFAQISDTHADTPENLSRLERAVATINDFPLPIECVIHTGDIVMDDIADKEVVRKMLSVIQPLKPPIHYLAGNHDVLMDNYAVTREAFEANYGPLASKAEYHGVIFLMLFVGPLTESSAVENYDPLGWLQQQLQLAGEQPVLIFIHIAPILDLYGGAFHPTWPEAERLKFEETIKGHNVKAVFAGHFHRDEFHWIADIPLFICPPVADLFGHESSLRVYEYNDGKISYWTRYPK